MTKYGEAPPFAHLASESARAKLIRLRDSVAPILDNNLLPHFTDHSVSHSDSLSILIDKIVAPIADTEHKLNEKELLVIYGACYLHDIGLQFENAGSSQSISDLGLRARWKELPDSERRDILRKHHHKISAEMVHSSCRSSNPIIGMQLTDDYEPSRVACLCECHNLYFEQADELERFNKITEDSPSIRMRLLAGLLRIADILDESRRRAILEKANTLDLDIVSQMHWWRHYYSEEVHLNPAERTITIWFDFPRSRFEEYSRIVPELQVPWIEAELNRHAAIFNRNGLSWTLQTERKVKEYSQTKEMPQEVFSAMVREFRRQQTIEDDQRRKVLLNTFTELRPHLHSRLEKLRVEKESLPTAEYLAAR